MIKFAPGLLIARKTPNGLDWDRLVKPRVLISIIERKTKYVDEILCQFLTVDGGGGGAAVDLWIFRPYDRDQPELPTINERTGKVEHPTLSWDWYVIGTGQEAYRKGHV